MTPEETGKLLGICAAFDNRNVDDSAMFAWYSVLKDLPYTECESAVLDHYSGSREWIMPADVRQRVKRVQRDIADRGRIRQLLDPAAYRAEVEQADAAFMRKLAQRTGNAALKAPPEPYTEADGNA